MITCRQKVSLSSLTGMAIKMKRKHAQKKQNLYQLGVGFITAMHALFTGSFDIDWEKETRMLWKEWKN